MNKPDRLIHKYPFNGSDKNLIDAFYIVGFEETFINEVIIPNLPVDSSYQPGILDSITSSEAEKISNENLFIKLIYPKNPEVISPNYISLNNNNKEPSSVIFSFSFDNEKGTSISSYSGYAFLFYELFTSASMTNSISTSNQSTIAYIPKAFIIISKFPFFTAFKTICKNVHQYFSKRIPGNVPIEVILYNIVNYTPSPLNCNLTLDFFPHDVIQSKVSLTQLSGYPLVDFDLSQVFSLLSVHFVLEIFLFSLFEIDMVFFSKNLELLNMIMYIIYILNYPCNDTIHLWHIVSFAKEDLLTPNHQTGMFVDKLCTMIIGVNCSYEESINPKQFHNYFVVDIDNRKLIYKIKDQINARKSNSLNGSNDEIPELQKYFQRIIKEKSVQSSFIEKLLRTLVNSLNSIGMESFLINASFIFSQPNNKTNFFEFDSAIHKKNRQIQEAFYDFYLKLLSKFYSNFTISYDSSKSSFDDQDKNKSSNRLYYYSYDSESKGLSKEEKWIMKLFQETNKFSNYFINFVKYFIYKDSYNIPLLFSEDLINILQYLDASTSNLFDLIDAFYLNKQSHRYTLNRQEKLIEYDGFYVNFYSALSNDYVSTKTSKSIRLNRKVLFKYMRAMNDQLESLKEKMLPSYATLKSNSIKTTFSSDIIDMIEEGMTQMNLIDSESLLITSIIIVFSITQFNCQFMFSVTSFHAITSLITKHAFRRKYVFILLLGYYKILREFKQRDKTSVLISQTNYYLLLNFILCCNVLPNENMMTVMSLLKKEMKIIEGEKKEENKEEDEPTVDNGNIDYEIELINNEDSVLNVKNETITNALKQLKTNKSIEFNFDEKKGQFTPKVRIKIGESIFESILFTPVKLKQMCENLFDRYLALMKNELIEDIDMKNVIITLVYYTKVFSQLECVRSFLLKMLIVIKENMDKSNEEKEKINSKTNENNEVKE